MTLSLRRIAIGVSGSLAENDPKVAPARVELPAIGTLPKQPWRTKKW
jgi:hypothetical protein